MKVLYQHNSFCDLYTLKSDTSLSKQRFVENFGSAVKTLKKSSDPVVILLEEDSFVYFTFHIEITSRDPFTISEYKNILQQKLQQIKWKEGIDIEYNTHSVHNCVVDGKKVKHYIGKQGDISFDLSIQILKKSQCREIKQTYGSQYLTDGRFTILPRSFYVNQYVTEKLHKDNFSLLIIDQETCALLTVQRGIIKGYETVNMGERLLRACYKEHDILRYLYEGYDTIEENSMLKKLVKESLEFYDHQVCNWLQEFLLPGSDLLLLTDLVNNPLFMSTLSEHYQKTMNGFIVPLNSLFRDSDIAYSYKPSELPVVSAYILS